MKIKGIEIAKLSSLFRKASCEFMMLKSFVNYMDMASKPHYFDELESKFKIFTLNHKEFVVKEEVEVSESELKELEELVTKASGEVALMRAYVKGIDSSMRFFDEFKNAFNKIIETH